MKAETLALYLGCNVAVNDEVDGKFNGMLICVDLLSGFATICEDGGKESQVEHSDLKLILRKLSSMTEEENKERDRVGSEGWRRANPPEHHSVDIHHGVLFRQCEEVRYLLSRHFDLFGLIESGEAIDSTKTESK